MVLHKIIIYITGGLSTKGGDLSEEEEVESATLPQWFSAINFVILLEVEPE